MRMLRPAVDVAMTLLLLLSMAWEMVGPSFAWLCERALGVQLDGYALGAALHEWIGTALILLFLWHLWLNRYWLKNLFKGRYNVTRAVLALGNVLLIVDVIFLTVSGVMMSKSLFVDLPIWGGMAFARAAHILASYWGYVIMSFHVGLYWHVASAMMFRRPGRGSSEGPSLLRRVLPHAAALTMMGWGAWAFVKRQIGDYMFLRSQFVFFDFDEPIGYFLLDYVAVMVLFACLGHYLILLLRKLKV